MTEPVFTPGVMQAATPRAVWFAAATATACRSHVAIDDRRTALLRRSGIPLGRSHRDFPGQPETDDSEPDEHPPAPVRGRWTANGDMRHRFQHSKTSRFGRSSPPCHPRPVIRRHGRCNHHNRPSVVSTRTDGDLWAEFRTCAGPGADRDIRGICPDPEMLHPVTTGRRPFDPRMAADKMGVRRRRSHGVGHRRSRP